MVKVIDFGQESVSYTQSDDFLPLLQNLMEKIDESESVFLCNWENLIKSPRDRPVHFWRSYFSKMVGTDQKVPKRDAIREVALCFLGSFSSMAVLGAVDFYFLSKTRYLMMIPAFAAMAVILYTDIGSRGQMAQPRNAFFGHVLSAIVGVTFQNLMNPKLDYISGPLAVSITIGLMSLTNTVHPAAGATALACLYGGDRITNAGWWFVLAPVVAGSIFLILVALLVNNLSPTRRYPLFWY